MAIFGLFGPPNVGKLEAQRNVDGLIKALTFQEDPWVRLLAARALGNIRDDRAVAPLVAALTDGAFSATEEDYQLAHRGQVMLNDKHKSVCCEALEALDKIDYEWGKTAAAKAAAQDLIEIVRKFTRVRRNDRDFGVRWTAVVALGKIGDIRAVEPLIDALEEKSADLSYYVIEALNQIGDRRATTPLISALIIGDIVIYKAAIRTLSKIDPAWSKSDVALAAVPRFLAALKSGDPAISWAAGEALKAMGIAHTGEPDSKP